MMRRAENLGGRRPVPLVTLAELPALARQLASKVTGSGFVPELIVYVETGARLLAQELAATLQVPLTPIWVRRGGRGLKRKLAPLAARLPVAARDWLRRVEERSGLQRLTPRVAALPASASLAGRRVLLVDDAADTGRTLAVARRLILEAGAAEVRTAVLAATTAAGRAATDFFVLDRNCRMPWSADSGERNEAERRARKFKPADAPGTF